MKMENTRRGYDTWTITKLQCQCDSMFDEAHALAKNFFCIVDSFQRRMVVRNNSLKKC